MKEVPSLIPEFFFDVIARLIPGVVMVYLIGWTKLEDELTVQAIFFSILISYLIGYILNIISSIIWDLLLFSHKKMLNIFKGFTTPHTLQEIWDISYEKVNPIERLKILKMIAEFQMFRSLSIIPIFLIFYSEHIAPPSALNSPWTQLALFILFVVCMLGTYIGKCQALESTLKIPK